MAKYIPDIKSSRWVILAPGRFKKPQGKINEYKIIKKDNLNFAPDCPFCPGNEDKTPPEIASIKTNGDWQIRVFSNKYPITDIHEVIAHSRDHNKEIQEMSENEIFNLFKVYQQRVQILEKEGVPFLFRNYGEKAGTSIPHPHTQIIVLPKQINLQILALESIKNIICETNSFIAYCPDFSQYPYEIWLAHKSSKHQENVSDNAKNTLFTSFNEEELKDVAVLLQKVLRSLCKILGDFSYNYYISPIPPFYLRIIPRVVTRGGFEVGTGLSTNVLDPQEAAKTLINNF